MTKGWRIITNLFSILFIATILVTMIVFSYTKYNQEQCRGLKISITDSAKIGFLNMHKIKAIIDSNHLDPTGVSMDKVRTCDIQTLLNTNNYIDSVTVYSSIDLYTTVTIWQRQPIARVMSENGYDFYIDTALYILRPIKGYTPDLPTITGNLKFSFNNNFSGKLNQNNNSKDYESLQNLINFVKFINNDEFLSKLIVQVYVTQNNEIELIPRVTNNIIKVGNLQDSQEKLLKLKRFFQSCFNDEFWKYSKTIDISYKNQVVVS